ncbi:alpha/beta fold hydrolase [Vibrio mexicanus]|uniref:alpha/beta fold hydrolase n=1 Tax=Vibrio mexicanus TaxID=1004326 RepID=UPI00063C08FC|nr:alpha/beta fold hydrolase [Vibrio mexicanus]
MSALLNYKLEGEGQTIILIHGLFGSLDNLGLLARDLKKDYQVLSIDLRNHGQSFHSPSHSYAEMAQDVLEVIEHLNLKDITVIGHSMGGKVAIKLIDIAPQLAKQLIVLDMSPVKYTERKHDNVISGLQAVEQKRPTTRSDALSIMAEHIEMEGVRQFLSKSLFKDNDVLAWRFNVASLVDNYENIIGWEPISKTDVPTVFVKGALSEYLLPSHQADIQAQFSNAKAHIIANTGHWLHAEKPQEVIRVIRKFLP